MLYTHRVLALPTSDLHLNRNLSDGYLKLDNKSLDISKDSHGEERGCHTPRLGVDGPPVSTTEAHLSWSLEERQNVEERKK